MAEEKAKTQVKKPTGERSKFGQGVTGTPVRFSISRPPGMCGSGCGAATKVKK
ncbi:hypothetical protein WAK64_17805 [Bacillus spongiae]|uniref:Uncharacterized protein n=1 Tax=Bacillus spongiae TaxID=2683610 RepID=A0ABU8HIC8_9BACI